MKHLASLTLQLHGAQNPAAKIGEFLIAHSNNNEYLAGHLRNFLAVVEADIQEAKEHAGLLLKNLKQLQVRVVVSATTYDGTPGFFPCKIMCHLSQYEDGFHYEAAKELAKDYDFEGEMVVYDEQDGPAFLFNQFDWNTSPTYVKS